MTYARAFDMGLRPQPATRSWQYRTRPRERLSAFLRSRYQGSHAIKGLARDIECSPRTAENLLTEHWPCEAHFTAIVRRWGHDVLAAVFGPEINETVARLQQEEASLVRQLEVVRTRRLQAQGDSAGVQDRGPAAATDGEG